VHADLNASMKATEMPACQQVSFNFKSNSIFSSYRVNEIVTDTGQNGLWSENTSTAFGGQVEAKK